MVETTHVIQLSSLIFFPVLIFESVRRVSCRSWCAIVRCEAHSSLVGRILGVFVKALYLNVINMIPCKFS